MLDDNTLLCLLIVTVGLCMYGIYLDDRKDK